MKNVTIKVKVSSDLELHDKCYKSGFNRGDSLESSFAVSDNVDAALKVCDFLKTISIHPTTWTKQKIAEHCNNLLVSHSATVLKNNLTRDFWNLYYPHLQIIIY